jgi:site-specific DNA-cytosine methylase
MVRFAIKWGVGCFTVTPQAVLCALRPVSGNESKLIAVAGFRGGDIGHSLRADPSKADKPSSSTYIMTGWDSQRQRIHDAGGVSPTLQSEEGRGHGVPTVLYGVSTNQRGEARLRDVHGALTASRSGKQFDGVLRALPSKAKKRCAAQVEFVNQGSGGNRGWAGKEEPTFTLTTSGPSGVCGSTGVRRLTPTECERLQGFPDGWTLIDDHTADTPRYRALGNAVAVPVAQWIAERIVQHARRSQAQEKAAG